MEQKDIVLIDFPFTNLQQRKTRPAVIVSGNTFNKQTPDRICCAVTSKIRNNAYEVPCITTAKPLHTKSVIRPDAIGKFHKTLIDKRIGTVTDETLQQIIKAIQKILQDQH